MSARLASASPAPASTAALGGFVVVFGILRLVLLIGWRDGGSRKR